MLTLTKYYSNDLGPKYNLKKLKKNLKTLKKTNHKMAHESCDMVNSNSTNDTELTLVSESCKRGILWGYRKNIYKDQTSTNTICWTLPT